MKKYSRYILLGVLVLIALAHFVPIETGSNTYFCTNKSGTFTYRIVLGQRKKFYHDVQSQQKLSDCKEPGQVAACASPGCSPPVNFTKRDYYLYVL